MQSIITLYLSAAAVFIVCDLLWLGYVAKGFYSKHLGYLLGEVRWIPAIIFYAIFIAGVTFFVTYPLRDAETVKVVLTGALFGFITYATYDLTNHATVKDWPTIVTIVDIMWGAFLGGFVSLCAVTLYRLFGG